MKKEISNLAAIRKYFAKEPSGSKIEMSELKALTPNERDELGAMSKAELSQEELFEETAA